MIFRIKNTSPYPLRRATDGSSGYDLHADLGSERWVHAGGRWKFLTGISVEIEPGYEAQVRGRSGLMLNHGIMVPIGTIDADYRGEIGVVLINLSGAEFVVRPGDRIAQLVFAPVAHPKLELTAELNATDRGAGGFGSSGR